jgi:hypothetical protein
MLDEETPRSGRSIGYSPRDDRFFTPRTVARSNSNSNSEEWVTPRYETPRYGVPPGYNSQSDNEFQTPRDTERKTDRKEIYPTLMRRGSIGDSPRTYENPYAAAPKSSLQRDMYYKEAAITKKHTTPPTTIQRSHPPGTRHKANISRILTKRTSTWRWIWLPQA